MAREVTIFRFDHAISMSDVESTLHLARVAASSLHGDDSVRQQAQARLDVGKLVCRIDTTRKVGQSLALIFGGYVRREFGDEAVEIERITSMQTRQPMEVAT